ncbi:thioredoxin, partial [Ligilactobacillus ruminis]
VMSIPTMIIQKDGKVVDTVVGYHEKDALKKIIEKYL